MATVLSLEKESTTYIFEVSKICGYSEFVLINKDESVLDFYKSVSHQFQCRDIK